MVIENVPIFYLAILKVNILFHARVEIFGIEILRIHAKQRSNPYESILVIILLDANLFFFFLPSTFVAEIFQSAIKISMRGDRRKIRKKGGGREGREQR